MNLWKNVAPLLVGLVVYPVEGILTGLGDFRYRPWCTSHPPRTPLTGAGRARAAGQEGVQLRAGPTAPGARAAGRGLHSSNFQLILSAVYGIGGARRGCVARVNGVSGGVEGA